MLVGNLTISIFQHWSDVMWMCDAGHLSGRQRVCTHSCRVQCSTGLCARAGPVYQFISYSEDVVIVFNPHHHVLYHIFADDKQLFASAPVAEAHEVKKTVERCVAAIKDWCASRRLKLNDGKTEVIWLGTRPRLQQPAGFDLNLSVGSDTIRPSAVVHDLGMFVDTELTFC